jgi:hypothetical protein
LCRVNEEVSIDSLKHINNDFEFQDRSTCNVLYIKSKGAASAEVDEFSLEYKQDGESVEINPSHRGSGGVRALSCVLPSS